MTDPTSNAPLIGKGWVRPDDLPSRPTNFDPYEEWVHEAFTHLFNSLDTALDELQRDRDFREEYLRPPIALSPEGNTRQECITEAVRRFVEALNAMQEGDEDHPLVAEIILDNGA